MAETIVKLPLKVAEDLVKIIAELVQTPLLSATERESLDLAERAVTEARKRMKREAPRT